MANARSRYDTIQAYMLRAHPNVTSALIYHRPALLVQNHPFVFFCFNAMAFRLHGRLLLQAQVLPGAKGFDPMHPDRHSPGWVSVPEQHFLRWDRYTVEALRCMNEALSGGRFSLLAMSFQPTPPPEPPKPPSPPASLVERFKRAFSALSWTTSRPGDAT